MPESQRYVIHNKREIASISTKNIGNGVKTIGPMILMSRGLVLQVIVCVFSSGGSGTQNYPSSIRERDRLGSGVVIVWRGILTTVILCTLYAKQTGT
ncbi:hypothetical protein CDAR_179101 [Caerostris darwini]|uniref:Uncharacterized protein n=1 Tax=Caerostris darwini TaxID=1538125 RepID=A0AAV4P8W0_9ARAC|nr:hypothetical protein CDAR_179101 [Caerostris darwini]